MWSCLYGSFPSLPLVVAVWRECQQEGACCHTDWEMQNTNAVLWWKPSSILRYPSSGSISAEQNSSNTPLPQCWFKLHQAQNQKQLLKGLTMIFTPSPLWDSKRTEHPKFICPVLILQTGTSCSNPKRWLLTLQNPAYARTACSITAFNFRPHKVPICTEQFLLSALLELCSQWFLHTA